MSGTSRAEEAFEHFVVPELAVLLRVARALTHHNAEAEDLVQDTLLRAYRSMHTFDGRHPRSWLLTILRNTHRNRHRRRRPELLRDPDVAGAAEPADAVDAQSALLDAQFDAEVETALLALPAALRTMVELVDIRGLSYAEAAAELSIPIGTVMSRLHRARRRLRHHLELAGLGPGGPR